jgi:hypothetical protein
MYSYLIEFSVKAGYEEDFIEHWGRLTEYIHREFEGLGSRLHKTPDGQYIAYAQWPDSDSRDADHPWTQEGRDIQQNMLNTLVDSRVIYELEVIKDLLK